MNPVFLGQRGLRMQVVLESKMTRLPDTYIARLGHQRGEKSAEAANAKSGPQAGVVFGLMTVHICGAGWALGC